MLKELVATRKGMLTQLLSAIAAGTLVSYSWCDAACAYLKGTFLGIDLLHVGLVFSGITILFSALKYKSALIVLLSSAAGVEIFLMGYQVVRNVYCPYCLVFGGILFLQLFVNFDRRKTRMSVIAILASLILFPLFFSCSTAPSYGDEKQAFSYFPDARYKQGEDRRDGPRCCITRVRVWPCNSKKS